MITFNLWEIIKIGLEGDGPVYEQIHKTLRHFEDPGVEDLDLTITTLPTIASPLTAELLGAPNDYYKKTENNFSIVKYGDSISVNKDFTKIKASSTAPVDLVRLLMEWRIRQELLIEGYSMIHASGVVYNDTSIIFPAWRHTGKTNTMLTFLKEGGSFLADDRLVIGSNGTVLGYPTDLHLLSYNYRSFPEIVPRSLISKLRSVVSHNLNGMTSQRSSIFSKGLNLINNTVIAENHWFPVHQVFPESDTISQTALDKIVLLRTTTRDEAYVVPIDVSELSAALGAINYREWDQSLLEIGLSHKSLTGNKSFEKSVQSIIKNQRNIFENIPKTVDLYKLHIPKQEYWTPATRENIFNKVIEAS